VRIANYAHTRTQAAPLPPSLTLSLRFAK